MASSASFSSSVTILSIVISFPATVIISFSSSPGPRVLFFIRLSTLLIQAVLKSSFVHIEIFSRCHSIGWAVLTAAKETVAVFFVSSSSIFS